MTVHQCIYVSQAKLSVDNDELVNILNAARKFNVDHNITGMLLYRSQTFLQMLEGHVDDIHAVLQDRIAKDPRHRAMSILQEQKVEKRSFANWSMGFSNLDKQQLPASSAYSHFLDEGFTTELVGSRVNTAHQLLMSFRP